MWAFQRTKIFTIDWYCYIYQDRYKHSHTPLVKIYTQLHLIALLGAKLKLVSACSARLELLLE